MSCLGGDGGRTPPQRFIQDFAKVSKTITILLCKDEDFIIDEEGKRAFLMLKQALIKALMEKEEEMGTPSFLEVGQPFSPF